MRVKNYSKGKNDILLATTSSQANVWHYVVPGNQQIPSILISIFISIGHKFVQLYLV